MNEKYGIELELITNKFKEKVNKIKDSFQSIGKQKVDMSKQVKMDSLVRQFELASNQVESLRHKLKGLNAELASKQQWEVGTKSYVKLQNEINKTSLQLEKAGIKADTLNDKITLLETADLSKGMGETTKNLTKGLDKMTSKIKRFGLSLLSIRSIWALVSRASSAYLAQDTELANKLQSVWSGLGSLLAPIIEGIANILLKAVAYINIFIEALTGVNLLAKATTKSMNGATKSAKALNKALGGFDELTNLDTDAGAGLATGALGAFKDLDLPLAEKIRNLGIKVREAWDWSEKIGLNKGAIEGMQIAWEGLKKAWSWSKETGLSEGAFSGMQKIREGIKGLWEESKKINLDKGVFQIFKNIWNKNKPDFDTMCNDISIGTKNLWNNIVNFITGIPTWIYNNILSPIGTFFSNLWEGITTGVSNTWNSIVGFIKGIPSWIYNNILAPIGAFFSGLWNRIVTGVSNTWNAIVNFVKSIPSWIYNNVISPIGNFFSGLWNGIKNTFSSVWNWILGAFSKGGQIFNGVKDGIVNTFKTIVNGVIGGINKVMSSAFGGLNSILNKIKSIEMFGMKPFDGFWGWNPVRVPQIPQLAVGTNYVPEDQLAYIHKGEAVVPKKFNSQEYFGSGNDETNSLLSQVIEAINNIEINPYTTVKDVGKASLQYINGRSRQLGESVVR